MSSTVTQHPTVKRIIGLIPEDLKDDMTGTYKHGMIYINTHVSFSPRIKGMNQTMVGLTLKAGGEKRRRTYAVKDETRPVSYHFWKIVRGHTNRMTTVVDGAARKKKLVASALESAKPYIDFMEGHNGKPDSYELRRVKEGKAVIFHIGDTLADATIGLALSSGVPRVSTFCINNKHLSVNTLAKIMALVEAETAKPEDALTHAVKKERKTLFD